MLDRWEEFSSRFSKVREQLDMKKITAEETFERGSRLKRRDIALQIVVILMCLVSFWSLTFLLMEVVSFFVEVAVYTLMGIIVNAGATMQYVTGGFLVCVSECGGCFGLCVRIVLRACVRVCVCAVSYTHLTLPTRSLV